MQLIALGALLWLGFVIGNFLYQQFLGGKDWEKAVERSISQLAPIIMFVVLLWGKYEPNLW